MGEVLPDWSSVVRSYVSAQLLWGHRVATALGLSLPEFAALNLIDLEGPATTGRVAEVTGLSAPATTRLVDRLVARGFVERVPDGADRRRVLVARTEAWTQEIDRMVEPHRVAMRGVLADFDPSERAVIRRYLEGMGGALTEM